MIDVWLVFCGLPIVGITYAHRRWTGALVHWLTSETVFAPPTAHEALTYIMICEMHLPIYKFLYDLFYVDGGGGGGWMCMGHKPFQLIWGFKNIINNYNGGKKTYNNNKYIIWLWLNTLILIIILISRYYTRAIYVGRQRKRRGGGLLFTSTTLNYWYHSNGTTILRAGSFCRVSFFFSIQYNILVLFWFDEITEIHSMFFFSLSIFEHSLTLKNLLLFVFGGFFIFFFFRRGSCSDQIYLDKVI